MENLFGIEIVILITGILIVCHIVLNIIGTILNILYAIKRGDNWSWTITGQVFALTIGILLIIIATSL